MERKIGQPGRPTGWVGQIVGYIMSRYNQPENEWTVSLLDIRSIDRILEIGFGPGLAIQYASKLATDGLVAGIDWSDTMLEAATKRNIAAIREKRVQLKRGDVAAIPYPDGSFDKVMAINSIYFWSSPLTGLKEIQRVLKPNGQVAIMARKSQRPEYQSFSGEQLSARLTEAGFRQVRVVDGPNPKHPILCVLGVK